MSHDFTEKSRRRKNQVANFYRSDKILPMTNHAIRRTSQRKISQQAILATLRYGKKLHRTGSVFFTLRKKDVAMEPELRPFAGTTLLVAKDGVIITAYMNKNSHSIIKKKPKRRANR
ncbi:DUF4258 domain-containing protein [Desulfonema magnum]|uniref:DUF4258 n=1 Tax=Desulfonema magnum TaxID=45655 RepID=A0A975BR80_9BACT|nr:DUF4258 domain-containing protein [Desulfonema magnum]QTA89739.1 DUF4258 [Desulfonema magnum]